MNWVHNHPELTTSLDEKGLSHENFGRGTKIYVRNFDEVHTAIEASCELVEDSSNNVPVLSTNAMSNVTVRKQTFVEL